VNTWETTYLHVLAGADGSGHPVLQWFAGTGLRPYLDALADDPDAVATFRAEVDAEFAKAYPIAPYGTVLPFRRIFVVAALP
jgi:trans-aconitate 2-methyltransferase